MTWKSSWDVWWKGAWFESTFLFSLFSLSLSSLWYNTQLSSTFKHFSAPPPHLHVRIVPFSSLASNPVRFFLFFFLQPVPTTSFSCFSRWGMNLCEERDRERHRGFFYHEVVVKALCLLPHCLILIFFFWACHVNWLIDLFLHYPISWFPYQMHSIFFRSLRWYFEL